MLNNVAGKRGIGRMSKRKSPPEQSELVLSPTTARVIQLSAEIQATPPDDIEFMHTVLCQVGLPAKDEGNALRAQQWQGVPAHYSRRNA